MRRRLALLLALTGLCAPGCCLPPQYHLIPTALPWSRAQTYCREHHADLATVSDTEDVERLLDAARGSAGMAWIGLHDNPTGWRWSFSDSRYYGGKEGDYRNWGFGQPDNFFGDEMCVRMWGGGVWESSRCFLRNPFICYDGRAASDGPFVFVAQELSWSDAQMYCRKSHTDLASVRNEKENQEMWLLAKNKGVWIGLYRTREWSDQSGSTFRHWKQGQPDNFGGKESCTAADLSQAGLWSDERCSRELAFVCYEADGAIPSPSAPSTSKSPTAEGGSSTVPISSGTAPTTVNVINLRVELTSNRQLSQGDVEELSAQLYYLLVEIGLPTSIKVTVRTIEERDPLEMEG